MITTHKIQVFLNSTQEKIYNQTSGACRWAYNFFINLNQERYKNNENYLGYFEVSKMITKMKKTEEYSWLKEVSQKAVKNALKNADITYRKFMKNKFGFPKFKSRRLNSDNGYYLYPIKPKYMEINKIRLPLLGYVRVANKKYIPHNRHIITASISRNNLGKYFISLSFEIEPEEKEILSEAIGIDLGIKDFGTIAFSKGYFKIPSFINDEKLIRYNKRIEKIQKIISNKAEVNYGKLLNSFMDKNPKENVTDEIKNKLKKESYKSNNIFKLKLKIRRLYKKISDYRKNKINMIVNRLVKSKPEYISIEDLSISEMISKTRPDHQKSLSRYISNSMFYYFKQHLIHRCQYYNIELRLSDKYFASSKICYICSNKKKDLKLDDRIYKCNECGSEIDRDVNAAFNLLKNNKYILAY